MSSCHRGFRPSNTVDIRLSSGCFFMLPEIGGLGAVQIINLRPLSSREIESLVASLDLSGSEHMVQRLTKAGGNPLFLEQLIRHSTQDNASELSDGLRSIIQARIDKLPDGARQAVQAASILGQIFSPLALCHLLKQETFDPSHLIQQSIIKANGDEFLFSHALARRKRRTVRGRQDLQPHRTKGRACQAVLVFDHL